MILKKVSLVKCETYDYKKVYESINENIKHIGGLSQYINKGDKILLKVNLVMGKSPDKMATTHPTYVKALANILCEYGATVVIGDSPGGPFKKTLLTNQYKISGFSEIAKETKATLNYNCGHFTKKNEKGLILKNILLADMLNDVDKVISVSKLKTHGMMTFTGGVKNLFGTVPGTKKAEYHFKMPNYDDFADALIDICLCANPVLSFMDGIIGMEGEGPTGGTPRKIGVSLASSSPYHMDKVATSIINLDFYNVPTIKRCIERKIITDNFDDLELFGENIDSFKIYDYKIPKTKMIGFLEGKVPKPINDFINRNINPKPVFDKNKCISCGICKESCPPKIITMVNNKPVADINKCIRCFCCQELCPKVAVSVKRPALLKIFTRE